MLHSQFQRFIYIHKNDDIIFFQLRLYGMFAFRQPSVVVHDPETLKQLTIKDFEYFQDKQLIGNESDKLIVSGN